MFGGLQSGIVAAQCNRNMLLVLLRASNFHENSHVETNSVEINNQWSLWVVQESKRRLLYCAWGMLLSYSQATLSMLTFHQTVLECVQMIFFDLNPSLVVSELDLDLPCSDALWQCSKGAAWFEQRDNDKGKHLVTQQADHDVDVKSSNNQSDIKKFISIQTFDIRRLSAAVVFW